VQEGSLLGTVGMQCRVGTCLYSRAPPAPSPAGPPKPLLPYVSHPEMATIVAAATLLLLLLSGTAFLIRKDQASLEWMRALHVRRAGVGTHVHVSEELVTLPRCESHSLAVSACVVNSALCALRLARIQWMPLDHTHAASTRDAILPSCVHLRLYDP
jgi:hypothetical protein